MTVTIRFFKCLLPASIVLTLFANCKKLLDPGLPPHLVVAANVYSNDSLAEAEMKGVYSEIMKAFGLLNGNTTRWAGIYSDELDRAIKLDTDVPFLTNSLAKDDTRIKEIWGTAFRYIYNTNDLILGVQGSSSLLPKTSSQLTGEALFIRALIYFYLVNLFGDVPLVTGTDYKKNAQLSRTPVNRIYEQMITDLQEARNKLADDYVITPEYPNERVRTNKQAASAFLARVLLYHQQWIAAEEAATEVIQSPLYQLESDLQQTFRKINKEAILQFMPVSKAFNTAEGSLFVPTTQNGKPPYILTDSLLKTFEPGDKRWGWIRIVTIGNIPYYSPLKYNVNQGPPYKEYNVVLRLAEQYLIRAEARIMQDKLAEGTADLNMIRTRAGLSAFPVFSSRATAMAALEKERGRELFAEWGHRWLDLKRWPASSPVYPTKADEIMSRYKADTWDTTDKLWPIPNEEIELNPNLVQNPGY